MQDLSLDDLIETVKLRDDEEEIAWSEAAFVNILFRFRKDVLQKCTVMCRKAGLTVTDAEDLANRVLELFYKYPNNYDTKVFRSKIPETAFCLYL